ncbi:MAG: hypothetical protein ACI8ZN_002143 [Bacteroidia bacterium]|jgi:hypothetical protein
MQARSCIRCDGGFLNLDTAFLAYTAEGVWSSIGDLPMYEDGMKIHKKSSKTLNSIILLVCYGIFSLYMGFFITWVLGLALIVLLPVIIYFQTWFAKMYFKIKFEDVQSINYNGSDVSVHLRNQDISQKLEFKNIDQDNWYVFKQTAAELGVLNFTI